MRCAWLACLISLKLTIALITNALQLYAGAHRNGKRRRSVIRRVALRLKAEGHPEFAVMDAARLERTNEFCEVLAAIYAVCEREKREILAELANEHEEMAFDDGSIPPLPSVLPSNENQNETFLRNDTSGSLKASSSAASSRAAHRTMVAQEQNHATHVHAYRSKLSVSHDDRMPEAGASKSGGGAAGDYCSCISNRTIHKTTDIASCVH